MNFFDPSSKLKVNIFALNTWAEDPLVLKGDSVDSEEVL